MATYQSRDDITRAYRTLLRLEQHLETCLEQEEIEADQLTEILEKQSEIMDAIEDSPELDQQVLNSESNDIDDVLEEFSRLRRDNRSSLQQYADDLEAVIESLDQAHELLKFYLQGEPRSGEEPSRRFDQEA